jgi:acyl-CoA synthetase (NDP forming)
VGDELVRGRSVGVAPGGAPPSGASPERSARALRRLLEARSVALVGASDRPGSVGQVLLEQLRGGGFPGGIYPVNPRHAALAGLECFPDLAAVAERAGSVDLAVLALGAPLLEGALEQAVANGVGSAVIFSNAELPTAVGGAGESGTALPDRLGALAERGETPLGDRLAALAGRGGLALLGGGAMGFLNLPHRLRICGFSEPAALSAGPAAFVSHSGSAFSALLHNDRRIPFGLAVSSGRELVTTTDEYLEYALDAGCYRVVALLLETIRRPVAFAAAARRAAESGVAIVALKLGRVPEAAPLVTAHSGALAGNAAAYDAFFADLGVQRVDTLDELLDVVALLSSPRRAAPGGLAAVGDSGGERSLLVDLAVARGVPLASIGPATTAQLAALLDPELVPGNPLDAWGSGRDARRVFVESLLAMARDPEVGAVAFAVDLTTEDPASGYAGIAAEVAGRTPKPLAVLANLASGVDHGAREYLARVGVPLLEGTQSGLAAFAALFGLRDGRALEPVEPAWADEAVAARWRARLRCPETLDEVEALGLLGDWGVPVVAARRADSLASALAAARELSWPVVLKSAASGLAHKSEVGGVVTGIAGPTALRRAYRDLSARLGPVVTVEAQAEPGVEVLIGGFRDPTLGPMTVVASGGVLVELVGDRAVGVAPLDETRALHLLERLRAFRLLEGHRGGQRVDLAALVRAVVRVSTLMAQLEDVLGALDANPVVAGVEGCVAVDALVVPRPRACASGGGVLDLPD